MGALLSIFTLACCCSSAACSLLSCCPGGSATATRIMYAFMLLLTTLVAWILTLPTLEEKLQSLPFCHDQPLCKQAVGYLAAYRLLVAQAAFFGLFALIMVGVRSSRDGRAGLQQGLWGIKYLIVIALAVGAFFAPEPGFSQGAMWVGLIGALLFILIQLILIVDLAHGWAEHWVERLQDSGSRKYYALLLGATALNFAGAIAAHALLYVYYGGSGCATHNWLISMNLVICIGLSVASILPAVQAAQPRSGLLQASLISLYLSFLTWSALNNDSHCKPWQTTGRHLDAQSLVGLAIWFGCVLYSSLRTSSNSQLAKITMTERVLISEGTGSDNGTAEAQAEDEEPTYSWSFLHVMLALASLYVMMTLTNWFRPDPDQQKLEENMASMWIKIGSSWLCAALYLWTLIAPIILPDRDFS